MKRYWAIGIFLVAVVMMVVPLLHAQLKLPLDTLLKQLPQARDSARVDILNSIAWKYRGANFAKAFDYAMMGLREAEALGYQRGIAEGNNFTGIFYRNLGNYSKAMECFFQARAVSERYGLRREFAYALNNIGEIYRYERNYPKAQEFVMKSLQMFENIRDSSGMYYGCIRLAEIAESEQRFDQALSFFQRALSYANAFGDPAWRAGALNRIGQCYREMGKFGQALLTFQEALELTKQNRNDDERAGILINIGATFIALRKPTAAEDVLLEGFSIADSIGLKHRMKEASKRLSEIYTLQGRHEEALRYRTTQLELTDSLFTEQGRKDIERLSSKYEIEAKQAQIQALQQEQDKQRLIRNGLAAFLLLVLVFVGVVVWGYRQQRRTAHQLAEQNTEILRQQEILEQQAEEIEIVNTQLQEINVSLEDSNNQLAERNAELHTANEALKEADNFRLTMLSTVSHDLKNPLNTIIGFSDVILLNPAQSAEYAQIISDVGWQMVELIKDLLDASARELGRMELVKYPMDMCELIGRSVEKHGIALAAKHQRCVQELPPLCSLNGDERRLQQVVDNLLSNAIKYAPHNTTITVHLSNHAAPSPHFRFMVKDEGPGISPEDQAKMFAFFQRLSAQPTGGESSHGVGLAIVKQIVELHGGKVWCESELGHGAAFVVEVPTGMEFTVEAASEESASGN
jgi:signal transduction histidine kinase